MEEGGTPRAQVTIYGPLVIVVLSLWPAPSEKWHPLLNPQRVAYGTPTIWDRWPSEKLKICCPHYLPFLCSFTMGRDAWLVSGDRRLVPTYDLGKCTEGRLPRGQTSLPDKGPYAS